MIRITDIRVPQGSNEEHVRKKAAHMLGIKPEDMLGFRVLKCSRDARDKKNILDVYSVGVETEHENKLVKRAGRKNVKLVTETTYKYPEAADVSGLRPVVAGFGPAGIFTALILAHAGMRPIVLERGKCMEDRVEDVDAFFERGILDPDSNVQFGEGGAGTFSDGKLNSGIHDREGRRDFVLQTFVKHGADRDILTSQHPHIGTDRLRRIIPSIRREIEELGGEIRFRTSLEDIRITDGRISSILLSGAGSGLTDCDTLFLCLGHSARDTMKMLYEAHMAMESKPFAVGVRIEHPRKIIDGAMHQERASYKLTYHCRDGRGVYSFCMCPGGYVIDSSSESGHLTVNGMSYAARDGAASNAAIVCTVTPEDFLPWGDDPLAGISFQRELERRAYEECAGAIPYQRFADLKDDVISKGTGGISPFCRGRYGLGNLRSVLPGYVTFDIIEAMSSFGSRIAGFDADDALLSGVEARTSSPVRILRRDDMQSALFDGIYPVGEGAGYAGGIMSSAIDGMKAAEAYLKGRRK